VGWLRFREWWPHKLPPLLAVSYLFLGLSRIPPIEGLPLLLLFLISAVGTAGFGHLLNDVSDRRADQAAGKPNVASRLGATQTLLALLLLLALSLLPWVSLPRAGLPPLLLILLLFVLYSLPPLRLKNRAGWGLLADALYAHGLPMAITVLVFAGGASPLTRIPWTQFLLFALVLWKTVQGVAGALCSQLQDRDNDVLSGIETLAVKLGPEKGRWLLTHVLQPLHLFLFLIVVGLVAHRIPLFAAAYLLFVAAIAYRVHKVWSRPLGIYREAYMGYAYLNDFHEQWMPWLALIWLAWQDSGYLILVPLHLSFLWSVRGEDASSRETPIES
jgi:4-hydroxybenzoate polyprenyltransferase